MITLSSATSPLILIIHIVCIVCIVSGATGSFLELLLQLLLLVLMSTATLSGHKVLVATGLRLLRPSTSMGSLGWTFGTSLYARLM